MALAALIFASHVADDDQNLPCAALPLAGATLLEHQVRRVVRAGAGHVVVLVERMPPQLLDAIDRLRRDGMRIDVARSVEDAADRIHPEEDVLVVADACLADARAIERLADSAAPAVLALADQPGHEDFERIDAFHRWAGLALISGSELHATADMLGEWDFELTLLRRTLQSGAALVPSADAGNDGHAPIFAAAASDLDLLEEEIIAGSVGTREGWAGRYLFPLIEAPFFSRLACGQADPWWIGVAAAVLALLAVPFAWAGLFWPALVLLMLGGPVASLARRLADVRITRLRHDRALGCARTGFASLTLVAATWRIGGVTQWGWPLIGIAIVAILLAHEVETRMAHALDSRPARPAAATLDGLIWILPPFAIAGLWEAGIAALAAYAAISFAMTQRRLSDAIAARIHGKQA